MTALVVGGSGLVGGALARALGRAGIGAAVTRFRGERDGAIELDVRDEVSVRACVRRVDPDLVFLAVNNPGGVDRCEDCPDEADALHVQGTRHVAEAAAERGATLVFYSTTSSTAPRRRTRRRTAPIRSTTMAAQSWPPRGSSTISRRRT